MGFFKRLFGICETKPPADAGCWKHKNGRLEIDLGLAPELAKPGGALRLEGDDLPIRVLVFQAEDGEFHALPNRCTHSGHRRLDPIADESVIRCCSIGKTTFDYQGKRLSGMGQDDIEPLKITKEGERLSIELPK